LNGKKVNLDRYTARNQSLEQLISRFNTLKI
jgi:hypothetical protein